MRPESRILYQLCALLLVASLQLSAQETKVVRDLMLWTGAAVEKSLGKDWTLSLGEEIRFKHNISEINNYLTQSRLREIVIDLAYVVFEPDLFSQGERPVLSQRFFHCCPGPEHQVTNNLGILGG